MGRVGWLVGSFSPSLGALGSVLVVEGRSGPGLTLIQAGIVFYWKFGERQAYYSIQ